MDEILPSSCRGSFIKHEIWTPSLNNQYNGKYVFFFHGSDVPQGGFSCFLFFFFDKTNIRILKGGW